MNELIDRLNIVASQELDPDAVAAQFAADEWAALVAEYHRKPDARWSDNALVVISAWIHAR